MDLLKLIVELDILYYLAKQKSVVLIICYKNGK